MDELSDSTFLSHLQATEHYVASAAETDPWSFWCQQILSEPVWTNCLQRKTHHWVSSPWTRTVADFHSLHVFVALIPCLVFLTNNYQRKFKVLKNIVNKCICSKQQHMFKSAICVEDWSIRWFSCSKYHRFEAAVCCFCLMDCQSNRAWWDNFRRFCLAWTTADSKIPAAIKRGAFKNVNSLTLKGRDKYLLNHTPFVIANQRFQGRHTFQIEKPKKCPA